MKKFSILTIIAAGLFAPVMAQTTFDDGDATDSYIENALNWDNGAPSAGNPGTISIDANVGSGTMTDFVVTQTAGNITAGSFPNTSLVMSGGSWTMNGGSFNQRSHSYTNGAIFTINNGTITTVNNSRISADGSGSQFIVNGGTVTADRAIRLTNGGNFTMNGGVVNSDVGDAMFFDGAGPSGSVNLNGGTLTGGRLAFQNSTTNSLTLGVNTAGSASFTDWGTGNGAGNNGDRQDDRQINLDFLTGTDMTLSLSATARELDLDDDTVGDAGTHWAQALWENDQLLYNSQDFTTLGVSWADATNSSVGFGSEYFDFSSLGSFGGSLGLAAVPEPSTLALLAGGLLALFALRRRK